MLRDLARLIHIARTLARHDALIPREFLDAMPPSLKAMRAILGLGRKIDPDLPIHKAVPREHAIG